MNETTLHVSATNISDCVCQKGFFRAESNICEICPAGKYKNASGDFPCSDCPGNSTSHGKRDNVSNCECTRYFEGPNGGFCTKCIYEKPEGSLGSDPCPVCFANAIQITKADNQSVCICREGYQGQDGVSCNMCPHGTYKSVTGNATCSECPNHATSSTASTDILACRCEKGYTGNGSVSCEACPAGTYKGNVGSAPCLNCTFASVSNAASAECSCIAGYTKTMQNTCIMCASGKYKSQVSNNQCQDCPAYSTSPEGSISKSNCSCLAGYTYVSGKDCVACDAGTYKGSQGDAQCSPCSQNKSSVSAAVKCTCKEGYTGYKIGSDETCLACDIGKYKGSLGTDPCTDCPLNYTTASEGSTQLGQCFCPKGYTISANKCMRCNQGEYIMDGSCFSCPANTYSSGLTIGIQNCTCPVGYFKSNNSIGTSSFDCNLCPRGAYNNESGQTFCTTCFEHSTSDPGSVNISSCQCEKGYSYSNETCLPCAVGEYKNVVANVQCNVCPENSTTLSNTSTNVSECICRPGYSPDDSRACVACPEGKYKRKIGFSPCLPCPYNSIAPSASDQCTLCAKGKFREFSNSLVCKKCEGSDSVPCLFDVTGIQPTYCRQSGEAKILLNLLGLATVGEVKWVHFPPNNSQPVAVSQVSATLFAAKCPPTSFEGTDFGFFLDSKLKRLAKFSFTYKSPLPTVSPATVLTSSREVLNVTFYSWPSGFPSRCSIYIGEHNLWNYSDFVEASNALLVRGRIPAISSAKSRSIFFLCDGTFIPTGAYLYFLVLPSLESLKLINTDCSIVTSCTLQATLKHLPTSFNQQSGMVVVVYGPGGEVLLSNANGDLHLKKMVIDILIPPLLKNVKTKIKIASNESANLGLQSFDFQQNFSIPQPIAQISSISPSELPSSKLSKVTIQLTGFPPLSNAGQLKVTVGSAVFSVIEIAFSDIFGSSVIAEIASNVPTVETLTVSNDQKSASINVLFFSQSTQASCLNGCIAPLKSPNLLRLELSGYPPSLTSADFIFAFGNTSAEIKNLISSQQKYLADIQIPAVLTQQVPRQTYFLRAALKSDGSVAGIANFTLVRSPRLIGATFNGFGSHVTLDFDELTNAPLGEVNCSSVIKAVNVSLGVGHQCYWLSAGQLKVILGSQASLLPTNTLSFIGNISDSGSISSTDGVEQSVVVDAPSSLPDPQVTLSGPNQISYCEKAVLVASVDSPRKATFTWSVLNDVSLNNMVGNVNSPLLTLTPSMLQTGMTYNITVSVQTFLGASSTSDVQTLFVSSNPIPTLYIIVPPSPYVRPNSIFFASDATFSPCDTSKGRIQMSWKISYAGTEILSGDGPFFEAKTTELVPGNQYTCTLFGFTIQGDILTTQVPFSVGYAGPKAKIEGGNRTISTQSDVILNASTSEDLDTCKEVINNQSCTSYSLSFQWSCFLCGNPCRSVNGTLVTLPKLAAFVYNFQHVDFSVCKTMEVQVQVLSGSQTDVTSVFLQVSSAPVSGAQIQVVSEDTFMVSLKGSCSLACSEFSWSIYDSTGKLLVGRGLAAENPKVPAGINAEELVLYRSLFSPGTYRLQLSAISNGILGSATKTLFISFPPAGGQCAVSPTAGAALTDTFTCSCQYWTSDAIPLSYVIAISPDGQTSQVSTSAPSSSPSYSFSLPAGAYDVYAEIIDSDGNSAVSGVTRIQVSQAPTIVNASSLSPSQSADVSNALDNLNNLGSVSQILQLSSGLASSLAAGGGGRRRLLASSLAYRMRMRTLLLHSMAKGSVKSSMNARTATSALSTSFKLGDHPTEIDPSALSDTSQVIDSCASYLSANDLRKGSFATLFTTENNVLEASKGYNETLREVTMLSVLNVMLQASKVYLTSMVPSEQPVTFSSVNMKMLTLRLSSNLKQYNISAWTYHLDFSFSSPAGAQVTQSGDLGLYIAELYAFWHLSDLSALQYQRVSQKPIFFQPVFPSRSFTSAFQCPSENKFCLGLQLSFPPVQLNSTSNYLFDLQLQLSCALWLTDAKAWSFDACQLSWVRRENETSLLARCSCSISGALIVVRNGRMSKINPALGLMPMNREVADWAMITTALITLMFGFLVFLVMFRNSSINDFLHEEKQIDYALHHEFQTLIGEVVFGTSDDGIKKQGVGASASQLRKYSRLCDDYLDEIKQGRSFYHSIWFKDGIFCKTVKNADTKVIRKKKCKVPDTCYKLT
eukprot:766749-Hanusia_phi.AAC.6